mmetsp:Transcript_8911/g.31229  ORF Transcript_8911/g.31229 Transcript_8911/m.31229 type:complete len:252 (-) Transcript_8911:632-1387(-)
MASTKKFSSSLGARATKFKSTSTIGLWFIRTAAVSAVKPSSRFESGSAYLKSSSCTRSSLPSKAASTSEREFFMRVLKAALSASFTFRRRSKPANSDSTSTARIAASGGRHRRSTWPWTSAVSPFWFSTSRSTFCALLSSAQTTRSWPFETARCSGVSPRLSTALTSAPAARKAETMSARPCCAASWSSSLASVWKRPPSAPSTSEPRSDCPHAIAPLTPSKSPSETAALRRRTISKSRWPSVLSGLAPPC